MIDFDEVPQMALRAEWMLKLFARFDKEVSIPCAPVLSITICLFLLCQTPNLALAERTFLLAYVSFMYALSPS